MVFTVQYKQIQFGIGSILSVNYCVSFSLNSLASKQSPSNQSRRVSISTLCEDPGTRKSHNKWLSFLLSSCLTLYSEHRSHLGRIKSHQVSHCGFNAFDFLAQFPLHSQDFGGIAYNSEQHSLFWSLTLSCTNSWIVSLLSLHFVLSLTTVSLLWFQLMSFLCPLHNNPPSMLLAHGSLLWLPGPALTGCFVM